MTEESPEILREHKLAAHRLALDLRDPKIQALDDDLEFRFALQKLDKPKLVSFELELK